MPAPERLQSQLRACNAAFTFLTRVHLSQVYRNVPYDPADLARGVCHFPIVGVVVAFVGAVSYALAALLWPAVIAVLMSIAATLLFTGALHEDGLADSFDGFGGGWDRAHIFRIMKDSRVGSYALVGLTLVLAAKIFALVAIAETPAHMSSDYRTHVVAVAQALCAAHVLSRWSSLPLLWRYDYARPILADADETLNAGRSLARGVTMRHLVVGSALTLLIVVAALGTKAIAPTFVAAGVTWIAGLFFERRLGGVTGDTLGAANQLVELAVYLTLAARLAPG